MSSHRDLVSNHDENDLLLARRTGIQISNSGIRPSPISFSFPSLPTKVHLNPYPLCSSQFSSFPSLFFSSSSMFYSRNQGETRNRSFLKRTLQRFPSCPAYQQTSLRQLPEVFVSENVLGEGLCLVSPFHDSVLDYDYDTFWS